MCWQHVFILTSFLIELGHVFWKSEINICLSINRKWWGVCVCVNCQYFSVVHKRCMLSMIYVHVNGLSHVWRRSMHQFPIYLPLGDYQENLYLKFLKKPLTETKKKYNAFTRHKIWMKVTIWHRSKITLILPYNNIIYKKITKVRNFIEIFAFFFTHRMHLHYNVLNKYMYL